MTRDADHQQYDESAQRWAPLLHGLHGRRRESVVEALRASVDQGYPASAEGVRTLVAYAQGQISARQYAARMLELLQFIPTPSVQTPAPAPVWAPAPVQPRYDTESLPDLATWRREEYRRNPWQGPSRAPSVTTPMTPATPASRRSSREETVSAYINGRIPVEEFLRLSRVRTT